MKNSPVEKKEARILDAKIHHGCGDLMVLVDHMAHWWDGLVYEKRDDIYLAIDGEHVSFLMYEKPGDGFGGQIFKLQMKDGSTATLIGPWTSNPDYVNKLFPEVRPMSVRMVDNRDDFDQRSGGFSSYITGVAFDRITQEKGITLDSLRERIAEEYDRNLDVVFSKSYLATQLQTQNVGAQRGMSL